MTSFLLLLSKGAIAGGVFLLLPSIALADFECTNANGQTYKSTLQPACSKYYPDCMSNGKETTSCISPNFTLVTKTTNTSVATATNTGAGNTNTTGTVAINTNPPKTNTNTQTNTRTQTVTNGEDAPGSANPVPESVVSESEAPPPPTKTSAAEQERLAAESQAAAMKALMDKLKTGNQAAAEAYRAPTGTVGSLNDFYIKSRAGGGLSGTLVSENDVNDGQGGGDLKNNAPTRGSAAMNGAKGANASASGADGKGNISASAGDDSDESPAAKAARQAILDADQRAKQSSIAKRGGKTGRSPSSLGQATEAELESANKTAKATEDPWVAYMAETSKESLVSQLKKDSSLRDILRQRIAEMMEQQNPQEQEKLALMQLTLAEADQAAGAPKLDDLQPMSLMEAFSMDAEETRNQIRGFLADIDSRQAEAQFLPQESLFQRVAFAHKRSVVRGSVKLKP